jgi:hypothetical protein
MGVVLSLVPEALVRIVAQIEGRIKKEGWDPADSDA